MQEPRLTLALELWSLVPVLLGDIGLETPYEPSIWTGAFEWGPVSWQWHDASQISNLVVVFV